MGGEHIRLGFDDDRPARRPDYACGYGPNRRFSRLLVTNKSPIIMENQICENCGRVPEGFFARLTERDGKPICRTCDAVKSGTANYVAGKKCPMCQSESLVYWRSRSTPITAIVVIAGFFAGRFSAVSYLIFGFIFWKTMQKGFRCCSCKKGFYDGETEPAHDHIQTQKQKIALSTFHWIVIGVLAAIFLCIAGALIFL